MSAVIVARADAALVSPAELATIDAAAMLGHGVDADTARRLVAEVRRAREDVFAMALLGSQAFAMLEHFLKEAQDWPPGSPPPADGDGH